MENYIAYLHKKLGKQQKLVGRYRFYLWIIDGDGNKRKEIDRLLQDETYYIDKI